MKAEVTCADPANTSSPMGCASPSSTPKRQSGHRRAACAHRAASHAPSPVSLRFDPVGASRPPHKEIVRVAESAAYQPASAETSPMLVPDSCMSTRDLPE